MGVGVVRGGSEGCGLLGRVVVGVVVGEGAGVGVVGAGAGGG